MPRRLSEAPPDCPLCPRLVEYREALRLDNPEWFNNPVSSFGDESARLLIVGLAPGVRGANRTGRPFTGDFAGDLLYGTLLKYDFATGEFGATADDTLELKDCMVTNAVRCVPPQQSNKSIKKVKISILRIKSSGLLVRCNFFASEFSLIFRVDVEFVQLLQLLMLDLLQLVVFVFNALTNLASLLKVVQTVLFLLFFVLLDLSA